MDWERIARAHAHPLRIGILELLEQPAPNESGWSPVALAERLQAGLGVVSHHVRKLERAGLIVLAGTRPRRGAVEHFYRST